MTIPVITIDGPAASGKGTVAKKLAARLGFHHLDSGRLYRCAALLAVAGGIALNNESAIVAAIKNTAADIATLNNLLRSPRLDHDDISAAASKVAASSAVRAALIGLQHAAKQPPGLVADGRDMGSVIFPDADLKVFLTASLSARAQRRTKQLHEKGICATLKDVQADLQLRDDRDTNRQASPLICPDGAVTIDSTNINADDIVYSLTQQFIGNHKQGE